MGLLNGSEGVYLVPLGQPYVIRTKSEVSWIGR
jgi:hypothetical protein